jgi:hypothetical protein
VHRERYYEHLLEIFLPQLIQVVVRWHYEGRRIAGSRLRQVASGAALALVGIATAGAVFVLMPVEHFATFSSSHGSTPDTLPAFFDRSLDPPAGEQIVEPLLNGRDVYGRVLPPRQKVLVVYGGTCSSCSLAQVSPASILRHPGFAICIVFDADKGDVLKQLGKVATTDILVFADPTARLSTSSNAAWAGRWYMYDRGRLKQVQQRPEERPW